VKKISEYKIYSKKITDTRMMKSGVTDLSGLRTIVLFPVDCNFAFKHVGRSMMEVVEKTSALVPKQYESRKRHKVMDLAVNTSTKKSWGHMFK
jgi:hypothetical protein